MYFLTSWIGELGFLDSDIPEVPLWRSSVPDRPADKVDWDPGNTLALASRNPLDRSIQDGCKRDTTISAGFLLDIIIGYVPCSLITVPSRLQGLIHQLWNFFPLHIPWNISKSTISSLTYIGILSGSCLKTTFQLECASKTIPKLAHWALRSREPIYGRCENSKKVTGNLTRFLSEKKDLGSSNHNGSTENLEKLFLDT